MQTLKFNHHRYIVKRAEEKDLEDVLNLLINAAEWLATKETTQWDYYLSDLQGNTQEVLDSIRSNATYILEDRDQVIASITLEEKPNEWDIEIWGEAAKDDDVLYLHRLVVHRSYTGKGLGKQLLKWAESLGKQLGKSYIRFDCIAGNKGLNQYYQEMYERKGIANIYGQHSKYEVAL